jgi:hypothetical protein
MARAGAESNYEHWILTMHIRSIRSCGLFRGGVHIFKNNASLDKNLLFSAVIRFDVSNRGNYPWYYEQY